jgi:hypothetical protein
MGKKLEVLLGLSLKEQSHFSMFRLNLNYLGE